MPKYITKRPRYVGGEYVFASIEHPAIIELPEGAKPAPDLIPHEDGPVTGEKLVPAYNPRGQGPRPPTAAEVAGTPKGGKPKRASDGEAI